MTFLKHFSLCSICALFLLFSTSVLADLSISEVYIESDGNNAYEAKIRANHGGMKRIFLIIADSLGLNPNDIEEVPYTSLNEVFKIIEAKNVLDTETLYRATVKYEYDPYAFRTLLMRYGNQKIQDAFYEYLIIPVFKQRDILTLWAGKGDWHKKWSNSRLILENAKLFYPKATPELTKHITSQNVLNMHYENCVNLFPSLLIKKVLLVVCEYFTNITTGAALMDIKYIEVSHDETRTQSKQYVLKGLKEVPEKVDKIFIDTLDRYGRFVNDREKRAIVNPDSINIKVNPSSNKLIEDDVRTITFNLEAYSFEELERIRSKLSKVSNIQHWNIEHEYNERYKLTLMTKTDDYGLAESFYLNKLSFRRYGDIYSLIDVINEGV